MKLGNGFGLLAAALAGFVFANSSASAAGYPDKPVKWVVGYPAGGTTDILARIIGNALSEKLGQQFIIENKPGAGNNIATEFVSNSAPDGYTVDLDNPAYGINASRVHRVHAAGTFRSSSYQAGILQYREVLRDRGAADVHARSDFAVGARMPLEARDHYAAGGVPERV